MIKVKTTNVKLILILLFVSNIIALNAKISDIFTKELIGGKASEVDEKYIREIAKEIGVTKNFEIYNMSQIARNTFTNTNAFAVIDKIFIEPTFLESLTEPERRFLIAHELMHIEKNHSMTQLLKMAGLGLTVTTILGVLEHFKFSKIQDQDSKWMARIYSLFGLSMISSLTLSAFSRRNEFEADREATLRLNDVDGGISFMQIYKKYYNKVNFSNFLTKKIISHPSFDERINQLEKLRARLYV